MDCCCTKTLDYCSQDVCGDFDLDILAQVNGVYRMDVFFLNTKLTLSETFVIGEKIIFPIDKLNESYQFTAEVYDPNGTRVLIRKDNIDYDCFKFKTVMSIAV